MYSSEGLKIEKVERDRYLLIQGYRKINKKIEIRKTVEVFIVRRDDF